MCRQFLTSAGHLGFSPPRQMDKSQKSRAKFPTVAESFSVEVRVRLRPRLRAGSRARVSEQRHAKVGTKTTRTRVSRAFILSKLADYIVMVCSVEFPLVKLRNFRDCRILLLVCMKKTDHITPVLKKVHWLPVNQGQNNF